MDQISTLKIRKFSDVNNEKITRFMSIEHAIDFIKNQQIHFSPLSSFKDKKEGANLKQASSPDEIFDNISTLTPEKRSEILYASCWYYGGESLHMWDIHNNPNQIAVAIQVDQNALVNKIFNKGNFKFHSDKLHSEQLEFKPSTFVYGNVKYIDFAKQDELNKKFYIGRFKDVAFKHENEFRFLLRQNNSDQAPTNLKDLKCKLINNAFKKLAVKLILSPYLSSDLAEFLAVSFKKLHPKINVEKSNYSKLF